VLKNAAYRRATTVFEEHDFTWSCRFRGPTLRHQQLFLQ
jgi:hypothetical protein